MNKVFQLSLIVSTFLIVVFGTFFFVSFNPSFYEREFEKYSVYDQFSENKTTVYQEFNHVLNYLQGRGPLEGDFFNEKEKAHLKDVKKLFTIAFLIFFTSILTFLLSTLFLTKQELVQSFFYTGIFTIGFFILLGTFALIDFQTTFIFFHKILFSNELWMLNPATDNLIRLLPQQLFFDLTFIFVRNTLLISLLLFFSKKILKALPTFR